MNLIIWIFMIFSIKSIFLRHEIQAQDILGCGGFIKSHVNLDFSRVEVKLFTKQGSLKESTDCSPSNGYYFLPLYDHGEYTLKISPPPGWSFEPQSISLNVDGNSDLCSQGKDINFVFKGFGITGKVETAGNTVGPPGISIQLLAEQNAEVRETVTSNGGSFYFTPVFPGKYTVKASHPKWRLSRPSVTVTVTSGNTELPPGSLVVAGYDVTGSVTSDGQPLSGVSVALLADKKPSTVIEGCSTSPISEFPTVTGTLICHVKSGSNGVYTFPSLPPGSYRLVPHYTAPGVIKFDIRPKEINIQVQHDSVAVTETFSIVGFIVGGRVLTSSGGWGVDGAKIIVNGKQTAITRKDGSYLLENLKPGTYTLQVQADNMEFKDHTVRITFTNPRLPDVVAHSFRVCGQVVSPRSHEVIITQPGSTFHSTAHSEPGTGQWCLNLRPGKYQASVKVTNQDKTDGLQFFPLSQAIEVSNSPISGVMFSQLKAVVSGDIKCLSGAPSQCFEQTVILKALSADGYSTGPESSVAASEGRYSFPEVLPGAYEVIVSSDNLCWESAIRLISVTTATYQVPPFLHTGYSVTFLATHDTKLNYKHQLKKEISATIDLQAGLSSHCVPETGLYEVTLSGCHIYAAETLTFDTSDAPKPVAVTAVSHGHGIRVVANEKVPNLFINIKTLGVESKIGPLVAEPSSDNLFTYSHMIYVQDGQLLELVPTSDVLLFSPPSMLVTGSRDCVNVAAEFNARKGRILQGKLVPPIAGATVTIAGEGVSLSLQTDSSGAYKFGPLDDSLTYTVTAEKESYILTGPDNVGNFHAYKLCEVIVTVTDSSDGKPLQGVLLTLSGGVSYRKNLQTSADGTITFNSLSPSDYFLRPVMKEYEFVPSSKMITVTEGSTVNVILSGRRVSYSAYGSVTSLSGEPVSQVVLEAVGQKTCSHLIEEGTSELSGQFRVRGLQPDCEYLLRVKTGKGINSHVDRSTPTGIVIKASNKDIEDLRIITFLPLSHMDVSVHLITPVLDHYRTLKVKLCREDAPNAPIHVQKLDAPGFKGDINPGILFTFPRIPADGKSYFVQVESTLPKSTHSYTTSANYFNANTSFKHFKLEFNAKAKTSEQDLNQTSVLALPLIMLVALAFFNQQKVADIFGVLTYKLNTTINNAATYTKPGLTVDHVVDENEIEQIVQNINAVKKKVKPKKI